MHWPRPKEEAQRERNLRVGKKRDGKRSHGSPIGSDEVCAYLGARMVNLTIVSMGSSMGTIGDCFSTFFPKIKHGEER